MALNKEDDDTFKLLRSFQISYFKAHEKDGEYPDPIDQIRIWKFVIKLASLSPSQIYAQTFPYISFYNSIVPEFSKDNPEFMYRQVEDMKTTKNVQNVVISIKPYIRVLPFLEVDLIFSIFNISINIITQSLKIHPNQIPKTFVSTFDDVLVEDFSLESFKAVVEYFKEMIDSEQKAQALFIFSCFALDFVKIDDHLDQFVKETLIDALNSEEDIIVIAGFNLLNEYSSHFQFEPESAPPTDFLIDAIFPRLLSQNDNLSRHAHEAAEAMIKCRIFQEDYAMNQILTTFDQYPVNNIDDFFNLLHVILYPVNDYQEIDYKPEMKKLVPIRSFVLDKLKNNPEPITKAHCINVISDLMSIKKSFVKKSVVFAFEETKKLISRKKTNTYHLISSFLDGMYTNYEQYQSEIIDLIPQLCEVLSKEKPLSKKQRLDLGMDIASICHKANKAPPSLLSAFAQSSINSKVFSEVLQGCCIVLQIMTFLNKKSLKIIFERLYQHVRSPSDNKSMNFLVRTMRKLLTKCKVESPTSENFLKMILSNVHLLIQDDLTLTTNEYTKYLCAMTKTYPKIAPAVFNRFYEIISAGRIPPPCFFLPIIATIETKNVSKEDVENLCQKQIKSILKKKKTRDISKLVCVTIETLHTIFNNYPEALNPIEEKVDLVANFLKDVDLSEQENPEMQNLLEIVPDACNFILDVYANVQSIDINIDLLVTIFNLLPFPVEVKCNASILESLLKIVNNEKFAKWKIKSCRTFAAYLLLNKKDLDEFKFNPKIVEQMVSVLKEVASENPQNFDKILKHFQNKNRDIPKLKELIQ